jgi:mono/diheme cytochrome c family protein
MEGSVQLLGFCSLVAGIFVASAALAADVDNGKRVAEMRCVACHIVAPGQRRDVSDAPPFEVIATKIRDQSGNACARRRGLHQHARKVVDQRIGL